jgi:DNA-binding Lrp family transcriptional regulator
LQIWQTVWKKQFNNSKLKNRISDFHKSLINNKLASLEDRSIQLISAYLFINLDVETEENNPLDAIQDIPEVKEAHRVYGTYDMVMLLEAESTKILKDIILKSVRRIQFVRSTMTLLSLAQYEKPKG